MFNLRLKWELGKGEKQRFKHTTVLEELQSLGQIIIMINANILQRSLNSESSEFQM
jgi:hypothetical protein